MTDRPTIAARLISTIFGCAGRRLKPPLTGPGAPARFFAGWRKRWLNHVMMQQEDVSAAAPNVSFRLALAEEARASMEAVREAQEAARRSARRQTRQARLLFAMSMVGLALAVTGFGPRLARWRQARHQANVAAPVASAPPASPSPLPAAADQPAAAPAAAAAPVNLSDLAGSDQGCDTALVRTAPWRLSAEGCARAFALHPTDAALALAVAHAEHAHARLGEAAQWARRALALDPNAAEAYVMIARAETSEGRPEEARAAYRRYLELAPRGWHHAEARAALRTERRPHQ
jgi:tetratricopeptide (TPR) repeat protein